jgi:quercetin dioxygenase-like cupin family protein
VQRKEKSTMEIVRLKDVELAESGLMSVAFPISSATGTADTAVVYLEFEPGGELAVHTDSAEELLLVLEGTAEGVVGDETARLETGDAAVVPALVRHGLRNIGDARLRVIGFFASSTNVAVFEEPLPTGDQVVVVGAPMPFGAPLPEPALA